MISKTYLQDAILSTPWVLKPIVKTDDVFEGLGKILTEPDAPASSANSYVCGIENIMQNAIRGIDAASGTEIVMLLNTYNRIVERIKSEKKWLEDDTRGTLQQCLEMVTREMASIDY